MKIKPNNWLSSYRCYRYHYEVAYTWNAYTMMWLISCKCSKRRPAWVWNTHAVVDLNTNTTHTSKEKRYMNLWYLVYAVYSYRPVPIPTLHIIWQVSLLPKLPVPCTRQCFSAHEVEASKGEPVCKKTSHVVHVVHVSWQVYKQLQIFTRFHVIIFKFNMAPKDTQLLV